ncbi:C4-dicarboxylate TRAP transporter substrate-binding protein [Puniceibacterium sp. IMCC21224]|uniref:C4-dicarboxylate TRAP transporter substrate-binding protein n=1 Tax=Puniceibacterium sp. IMCC21224 TaxID=1618204 RepID=UPI00065D87B9|nr:C4-dicarboxylate TRAP transporter substrate-binding protein [Puniceibacterium sp. IMCC21224]KMK64548.1 TRAP-type C4-dicarboxylate transport system, periplasmic component [Puniceibacterium sp. IMCC21224]
MKKFNSRDLPRREFLLAGAAAAALATPSLSRAGTRIRLTFATGFAPVLPWVKEATETFLPTVEKTLADLGGEYSIEWTTALSGSLARPNEMLAATRDGLCEVALIAPIFEPTALPLDNIGFVTPFSVPDHRVAVDVINALHRDFAPMTESWQRQGLVHLGSLSNERYAWFTNFPWSNFEELASRKIAGAGMALPWIGATQSTAVATNFATAYNDMSSGLFDGIQGFPSALAPSRFYEIAPHVKKMRLGAVSTLSFAANRSAFISLPGPVQQALIAAGQASVEAYKTRVDVIEAASYAAFENNGAIITEMSDDQSAAWAKALPPLSANWAESVSARGIDAKAALRFFMDFLAQRDVTPLRDWSL